MDNGRPCPRCQTLTAPHYSYIPAGEDDIEVLLYRCGSCEQGWGREIARPKTQVVTPPGEVITTEKVVS